MGARTTVSSFAWSLSQSWLCNHVRFDHQEVVPKTGYPRTLYHPGFPIGGATGLLIKDYRGKNAEQEIWTFDQALVYQ